MALAAFALGIGLGLIGVLGVLGAAHKARGERRLQQIPNLRRLLDALTTLQQQNAALTERLNALDTAHRQLVQQVAVLRGRGADDARPESGERILH